MLRYSKNKAARKSGRVVRDITKLSGNPRSNVKTRLEQSNYYLASGRFPLQNAIYDNKLPFSRMKYPYKIKSTANRHRISSTLLASMDVSDKERELFYKHMGHSQNDTIYQVPAGIMEVTKVGKFIMGTNLRILNLVSGKV